MLNLVSLVMKVGLGRNRLGAAVAVVWQIRRAMGCLFLSVLASRSTLVIWWAWWLFCYALLTRPMQTSRRTRRVIRWQVLLMASILFRVIWVVSWLTADVVERERAADRAFVLVRTVLNTVFVLELCILLTTSCDRPRCSVLGTRLVMANLFSWCLLRRLFTLTPVRSVSTPCCLGCRRASNLQLALRALNCLPVGTVLTKVCSKAAPFVFRLLVTITDPWVTIVVRRKWFILVGTTFASIRLPSLTLARTRRSTATSG